MILRSENEVVIRNWRIRQFIGENNKPYIESSTAKSIFKDESLGDISVLCSYGLDTIRCICIYDLYEYLLNKKTSM